MKAIRLGSFALIALFAVSAFPVRAQKNELKFFMSPRSNVPQADVLRNLNEKCPGATIVLDPKKSDYMLEAFGWSGNYKFVLFKKGGEAVYSTNTVMLSNSVKNVCKFVSSHSATP